MKRRKWSIATAILLCAVAMTGVSEATISEGDVYHVAVSTTSCLNVREQASTDSLIMTTLERGETVTATGVVSGSWIEVQTDKTMTNLYSDGRKEQIGPIKGWVMLSMLSTEAPYSNVTGDIKGDGRVRMREDPNGEFIQWVYPGETVSVLSVLEIDGTYWYRIRHGDVRGWVMSDYLDFNA